MHAPIAEVPRLDGAPDPASPWADAPALPIAAFHASSTDHRPQTRVQVAHTGRALHLRFTVEDRYVRVRHTGLHAMVWRDSCVEAFIEPRSGRGYFNFEFNAGGSMLLWHVRDARRVDGRLADYTPLPADVAGRVAIRTSLPAVVEPEIAEPVAWWAAATIPLEVFESRLGPLGELGGQAWRANLYKCGDETSHPHWASWSPIGDKLNFHQPDRFGTLVFLP